MPNRYVCSVLEEIRECTKTQNYSYLSGLVEEAQSMVNRMEATLWDQKQLATLRDDIAIAKKKLAKKKHKLKENDK